MMDDDQFRQILQAFDLSWDGYRKVRKGVKKRLARHMADLGARTISEYLEALDGDPELRNQVQSLLTVTISRFFRDRKLWQDLATGVLPQLVLQAKTCVRVWSAGCACGEEPYSFAIVWDQFARTLECPPKLELIATEREPRALEKAREGVYSRSSLKEVDAQILTQYFHRDAQSFMVRDFLKKRVTWELQDLIEREPPPGEFQLIFLRNNLLTYCSQNSAHAALERILNSLSSDGFLIIGAHEKIPIELHQIAPSGLNSLIFRKLPEKTR